MANLLAPHSRHSQHSTVPESRQLACVVVRSRAGSAGAQRMGDEPLQQGSAAHLSGRGERSCASFPPPARLEMRE
eukprot:4704987-Pleurochrysis_carterae.AAC.3